MAFSSPEQPGIEEAVNVGDTLRITGDVTKRDDRRALVTGLKVILHHGQLSRDQEDLEWILRSDPSKAIPLSIRL